MSKIDEAFLIWGNFSNGSKTRRAKSGPTVSHNKFSKTRLS